MSTLVWLRLGVFRKYTGRNEWYEHHGDLFQPRDIKTVPRGDSESDTPRTVLSKPFRDVIARLRLLGICDDSVKKEYDVVADQHGFFDDFDEFQHLDFAKFRALINSIDVSQIDDAYIYDKYHGLSGFFKEEIAPSIGLELSASEAESAEELFEHMSANSILWLLSQAHAAMDQDLVWDYSEHVESGYSKADEHIREVSREYRFLIVTEGTSDSAILKKAFELRRPEIADFFYFIDVDKEKFPYPGHGGLKNFSRSLITINVLNQTIVIFDNDAAAKTSFNQVINMALPSNIRALILPDIIEGSVFETIGPDGPSQADINGRAAGIEAYLDLSKGPRAVIRWKNFEESLGEYHGELENKQEHAQIFYELQFGEAYDFCKLDMILEAIVGVAEDIARARTA